VGAVLTGGDLCLTLTAFGPGSLNANEAAHQNSGAFVHSFFELLVLVTYSNRGEKWAIPQRSTTQIERESRTEQARITNRAKIDPHVPEEKTGKQTHSRNGEGTIPSLLCVHLHPVRDRGCTRYTGDQGHEMMPTRRTRHQAIQTRRREENKHRRRGSERG
jgi:hypothetical protein